jgi:hypothetical protein
MPRSFALVALLGLTLAGCKSSDPQQPASNELYIERHIITTMTSRDLSGKTFTLENAEDVLNSSTEYRNYAKKISSYLEAAGMHEIEKSRTAHPDFEAVYKYSDSITGETTKTKTTTSSRPRRFFGFSDNGETKTVTRSKLSGPVYHSELELKLYEPLPANKASDGTVGNATSNPFTNTTSNDNRKVLYESVSFGNSSDRNQRHIIPELINFQLKDFPGSLGDTSRTTIQLPDTSKAKSDR